MDLKPEKYFSLTILRLSSNKCFAVGGEYFFTNLFIDLELIKREKIYKMADYIIDTNNLSEKDVLQKINRLLITI